LAKKPSFRKIKINNKFPLGEHDTPDWLLIPEKLYGRAREIDTLLSSFERAVTSDRPELVLVSGYSGVGKSSFVNELHKPLVTRGAFLPPASSTNTSATSLMPL
jgi:predicted AAA+ superfamily ATPase